jgi:hypothetical protein
MPMSLREGEGRFAFVLSVLLFHRLYVVLRSLTRRQTRLFLLSRHLYQRLAEITHD